MNDFKALDGKNLRYVSDNTPGIYRKRKGKGFIHLNFKGEMIRDPKTLDRIESLVIPPAWRDVWICPYDFGHLQATGRDEKGRKQYRYHNLWIDLSSKQKFDKLPEFSQALPWLRAKVERDLKLFGLKQEKILATVVWLLDKTLIRVGNDEYARENKHYGLTTLRRKHVKREKASVFFEFTGKSGKKHRIGIFHPKVTNIIKKLEELPGYELFQYIDEHGQKHVIDSEEVNQYLKEAAGDEVSAKDFRTWGGTVHCAVSLNELGNFETETDAKDKIKNAIKNVSKHLGNTPTICHKYYIHPLIIESYQKRILLSYFEEVAKRMDKKPAKLTDNEYKVKKLLEEKGHKS